MLGRIARKKKHDVIERVADIVCIDGTHVVGVGQKARKRDGERERAFVIRKLV